MIETKAYLDGEASPAERGIAEAAFAENAALRAERDDFAGIAAVVAREVPSPEARGMERTLLALRESAAPEARAWWLWPVRLAFAAGATGLLFLPSYLSPDRPDAVAMNDAGTKSVATGAVRSMGEEYGSIPTPPAPMAATKAYAPDAARAAKTYAPDALKAPAVESTKPPSLPPRLPGNGPIAPMPPMLGDLEPLPPMGVGSSGAMTATRPPVDVARVDAAVRKVVAARGGRVDGSAVARRGGQSGRTILVSIADEGAIGLAQTLRKVIGDAGTVSDPVGSAEPSARTDGSAPLDEATEARIKTLQTKREELLKEFYEDAGPVKEIDAQIAEIREEARKRAPKAKPRKTITVTILP